LDRMVGQLPEFDLGKEFGGHIDVRSCLQARTLEADFARFAERQERQKYRFISIMYAR
jgi:hypothetical protein